MIRHTSGCVQIAPSVDADRGALNSRHSDSDEFFFRSTDE